MFCYLFDFDTALSGQLDSALNTTVAAFCNEYCIMHCHTPICGSTILLENVPRSQSSVRRHYSPCCTESGQRSGVDCFADIHMTTLKYPILILE